MVQFKNFPDPSLNAALQSHPSHSSELEHLKARMQNFIKHSATDDNLEIADARVTAEGMVTSLLKERLDTEYEMLMNKITREVNVEDYGAVPDGRDNTEAFRRAIGNGRVKVNVPAGEFLVQGIKLPSWTTISGEGQGITVIKLHEDTPAYEWVITNDKRVRHCNSGYQIVFSYQDHFLSYLSDGCDPVFLYRMRRLFYTISFHLSKPSVPSVIEYYRQMKKEGYEYGYGHGYEYGHGNGYGYGRTL